MASETARIATLVEVLFQFGPRDGTDAAEADAEEVMVAGVEANTPRIASTEEVMAPGEAAQKKSVIGAHNRCWKYLNDVVPSLPMVKQKEALNSLEEIKTGN